MARLSLDFPGLEGLHRRSSYLSAVLYMLTMVQEKISIQN